MSAKLRRSSPLPSLSAQLGLRWPHYGRKRTSLVKRAAIDVFLKTEMDKEMVKAYRAYEDGLEKSKRYKDIAQFYNAEIEVYRAVRTYLDVNELICIGINQRSFRSKGVLWFLARYIE
jgi:hypothetical protein